jgi:signal transduction histidine kinase
MQFRSEAMAVLDKIRQQDTLTRYAVLLDSQKTAILSSGKNDGKMETGVEINPHFDSIIPPSAPQDFATVGKLFLINDSIYFPIIAAVSYGKKNIGYLIRWRIMHATPKAIEQFGQLIGSNGTLYIGNDDGKFWTDLIKPVPIPPYKLGSAHNVAEYTGQGGEPLLASEQPVPGSRWQILIEFSKKTMLEAPDLFLRWIIMIDVLLVAAGSFIAWVISRNITRPLKKLTEAAAAIAGGNYTGLANIKRHDELGKLAEAFNIMAVEVRNAQLHLEKKVQDRTAELESANKELESFSYSVSHDLHAPLRIIDGYADVLLQKHSGAVDDDAKKILTKIQYRARRMRKLIDELLNLSYLGRKKLSVELVDMNAIVQTVINEQLMMKEKAVDIEVKQLGPAVCDSALIVQVWSNLLSNAIKYSAKNENPYIEIDSFNQEGETVYLIKDNGVGFDMKYSDKLFGVFQRLHNVHEFEGSGIGLSLVQRVIDKHGGRVWAEGEVDKGATFYFSLKV